ncbi:hypothetical protein FACS189454_04780 [Planctomycetales bacterium]|nr:hypothetical protein FACS189454_04780 [Planctomycetales bacterium]
MKLRYLIVILFLGCCSAPALALEYVEFQYKGKKKSAEGQVIVDADDGIALESRDGYYYVITPDMLIKRKSDKTPFVPYTKKEAIDDLKKEFPESKGYYILDQKRFLVVYNTSRAFANWYGRLLEKLYSGFVDHWKRQGVDLETSDYPLVAVVLSSKEAYQDYAKREGTRIVEGQCAYYNRLSNRVVMYDMTGQQTKQEGDRKRATNREIELFLAQPNSYFNVSTVVHEAVHQVGFNCGMHSRFAPIPVWVCEGLAEFHAVPYAKSDIGWVPKIRVNPIRLELLHDFLKKKVEHPLQIMLKSDNTFRDPQTMNDAYALAWGLVYYLAQEQPKELADYLNKQREKTPVSEDSPKIRMRDFENCFGDNWNSFETKFERFYRKLKTSKK